MDNHYENIEGYFEIYDGIKSKPEEELTDAYQTKLASLEVHLMMELSYMTPHQKVYYYHRILGISLLETARRVGYSKAGVCKIYRKLRHRHTKPKSRQGRL